jgi:transposase
VAAIKPMLPNKPRGVPQVNDRRVLNGIFWVLRSGAPWRDLPNAFGPYTTKILYNWLNPARTRLREFAKPLARSAVRRAHVYSGNASFTSE